MIVGLLIDHPQRERFWKVGTRDTGRLAEIESIDQIRIDREIWYRVSWSNGDFEWINGAHVTVVYHKRGEQ